MSEPLSLEAQRRLNFTQNTRERLAQELMADGKMPQAEEDRHLLLKVLDGIDRNELSVAKLKIDNKSSDAIANATDLVANVILNAGNISKRNNNFIPELPDELSIIDLVPGETDVGVQTFSYQEMVK